MDLGATKIAAGIVEEDGQIRGRVEAPAVFASVEGLYEIVGDLVQRLGDKETDGIGIGAAGLVQYPHGRYLYGPNTGLRDLDLGVALSEALGLTVRVDNDANCAAWGEHRFGSGRGTQHFLCVTLGTGIGGGLVIGGQPYRGARGGAGEIGHMLVDPQGPRCGCGRRGCWEQFGSGLALQRSARDGLPSQPGSLLHERAAGDPSRVTAPMVTQAARDGDAFARTLVEQTARWVGWGLGSLVNIFEPERVAVSGGLAREWDLLGATVAEAMREQAEAPEFRALPELVPAELGYDAGLVGAGWLVLEGTS